MTSELGKLAGMNSRPSSHHRILAGACLLFACGLLGISIYLGNHYSLPVVGTYQYGIIPSQATLIWFQDARIAPDLVEQLDLRSGIVSRISSDIMDQPTIVRNSRGQRIVLRKKLEILDDKSGQLLWSGKMPFEYPTLIGDHYLIEPGDGHFKIIDLDRVIETGCVNVVSWPVSGIVPLDTSNIARAPVQNLHKIEGTDRFLYDFQDADNPHVIVFEIDAGQLRSVASWPIVGDSQVSQYNGTIMSASPSSAAVEVRSLNDFQLIKKLQLPPGLSVWGDFSSGMLISQNLFSFSEVKTGITRVHRMDDFALIPELDLPVSPSVLMSKDRDDEPYVLLSDNRVRTGRIVVYDTFEKRVVVDRAPPLGMVDYRIAAGHLVVVNELLGLTVDMIDLKTGQLAKRYQPFAWVAWAVPIILLLALAWLIVWIRLTAAWPGLAVINIIFIAALFVAPQLTHVAIFGGARILFRPAMGYACVVLMALSFCLSLYVVYGRQRVLLRTIPVWLALAVALGISNMQVAETGKRGLEGMSGIVGAAMRLLVEFSFVSIALLACMRIMGFGLGQPTRASSDRQVVATIPLRDMFVFTACIAAFIAAAAPNRAFLLAPVPLLGTVIASLLVAAPALLGLIALAPSTSIVRFMRTLALLLAILLIAEISMHISMGHWHTQIWYSIFIFIRYFTFMFLVMFIFGSILRSAGYRWQRTSVSDAKPKPLVDLA